jgi:GT2 family glycosyltransferase
LEVRWGASEEEKANAEYPLVLISIGKNLGYAGGNNVGLRYVQSLGDYDYIWLLNNDTVVHPDALTHLVRRMEEKPDAGICGSTLPFYDAPDRLWARGGATYNKWTGFSRCIGLNLPVKDSFDRSRVENAMKYVAGASMLVSRPFLQDAGFLSEEYFLYFEELDWITGAKGRYRLAYSPESVVFHKVGASTGNGVLDDEESLSPKGQMEKSRMIYTRKYFPFALPTVFLYGMARRWASFLKKERKRW